MGKNPFTISINPPANPTTSAERQNAVDAAEAMSVLRDARLSGLATGGPTIDIDRCQELLERGRALGIVPSFDCIERLVGELAGK